ncbi:magnesium transporter CorA family protein [Gordonia soli]|uniref:Putative metal ion transport protein n=1 Tax=Gordonia soli NBRC 108243 TaxID=1223545 RepID=M0QGL4_9ACTN|nr:magnesium transporter CorA family protein [Gordonia soli]GAC67713.1 putative metal ion transport protein [Gordonia soli NBRC 108243]
MTEATRARSDAREHVRGQVWEHGEPVDGFELTTISEHLDVDGTLVWADILRPTHETLAALADELELDPFAVEDAVAESERVKTVAYARHTFLTVYAVSLCAEARAATVPATTSVEDLYRRNTSMFDIHRVSVFVRGNVMVTIRLDDGFDIGQVVDRWDEIGSVGNGVGALVHGLLDVIVDGHFEAVQALDDAIEDIEGLLFDESISGKRLEHQTYRVRKDLVSLRRIILPMRDVIAAIQRRRLENKAPSDLDPHFSDLYDHALRAAEWTESLRDMITTVFETNLSMVDARLNTVMKKLTGWAAIIAVPTAITGFYGQNVPYPGIDQWWGFVISSALIVGIVALLYLQFRRKDWL